MRPVRLFDGMFHKKELRVERHQELVTEARVQSAESSSGKVEAERKQGLCTQEAIDLINTGFCSASE